MFSSVRLVHCASLPSVPHSALLFLSLSLSVQEPGMQGVQVSNGGLQVDASARANGGVHFVLQYP